MSTIKNRRFTDPEFLRQIHPNALLEWLRPAKEFLASKGFEFPTGGSAIDYDRLLGILADPDIATPDYLLESIHTIGAMADEAGMIDILRQKGRFGLNWSNHDDVSPADIAVQAWLNNSGLLETMVHERQLSGRRAFNYFVTDQRRLTPFTAPNHEQLEALEHRLDAYYKALKRGRGCKVFVYPSESELLFFVRHGRALKRAAALKDGEPTSIFYRPQQYDVVIYNIPNDELRMNCCTRHELKVFKRIFGSCLFGDANYFPGNAIYTLDPLLRDGRESLVCTDVPGMKNVVCKEVEITYDKGPERRENIKARDIFSLIDQNALPWPAKGRLSKATFEIRFTGSGKSRKVTILPSNKLLLTRDADAPIVHDWLHRRSFTSVS